MGRLLDENDVYALFAPNGTARLHVADIDVLPRVNIKEVVHGRWEKDPDMRRMDGYIYDYRCSHCHLPAVKGYYNNNDRFTIYCPNCGAKMDLED